MRINAEDYGPLSHLAREGSNDDIGECLSRFDSYARAEALAVLVMFASPRRALQIFLEGATYATHHGRIAP
jgi:hypothetical protein